MEIFIKARPYALIPHGSIKTIGAITINANHILFKNLQNLNTVCTHYVWHLKPK